MLGLLGCRAAGVFKDGAGVFRKIQGLSRIAIEIFKDVLEP